MTSFDAGALAGQLRAVAQGLRATSDEVHRATQEAQAAVVRLADDDGLAEVEVDGRPRVREIRLSHAARHDADRLDALLTGVLNRALARARANTRQAVSSALPPAVRRAAEDLPEDR
jgi:DNA-binding protein YbaB